MMRGKTLSALVVACVALFGFGVSGNAVATELCSANEAPCSTAHMYATGTIIHAVETAETESKLVAGFATVSCKVATFEAKTSNTGGSTETVEASIENLTYTNCNCPVTVLVNGSLEFHTDGASASGNGTVTAKGELYTITCNGVSCKFGSSASGTDIGTLDGGNPAELTLNGNVPWFSGDSSNFVCTLGSGTGALSGRLEITSPKPLFVE